MARAADLSFLLADAAVASVRAGWIDREPILFPPWRSDPVTPATPLRTAAVSYVTLRIIPNMPDRTRTQQWPPAAALIRSSLPAGLVWWTDIRPGDRRGDDERPER